MVLRLVHAAFGLTTLVLSACSSEPGETMKDPYVAPEMIASPTTTQPPPNAASRQLLAMAEAERLKTFREVVTSSRGACAEVTRAERRRTLEGGDVWVLQCRDTGAWAVKVNSNFSTRLLSCDFLAKFGTPCETL